MALYRERSAISELIRERNDLHVQRVITTAELWRPRAELNHQLVGGEARIAEAGKRDLVAPLIRDPVRVWGGLDIEQKRAVVRRLFDVTISPAPKGRPPGWKRVSTTSGNHR